MNSISMTHISIAPGIHKPLLKPDLPPKIGICFYSKNPSTIDRPSRPRVRHVNPVILSPEKVKLGNGNRRMGCEEKTDFLEMGAQQMMVLGGLGYWIQGFRCFPWLGLNFHMAQNLNLCPATLQLVQNSANLPMVIKPLYGILSDVLYIGTAHRIPYIAVGVFLQAASWGILGFLPFAASKLPVLMCCILLSNLGASITEVAQDALTAEYGQRHNINGLQSFAFMASAAGGILGNLLGGFILLKTVPKSMFLIFTSVLCLQFATSLTTKEESFGLPQPSVATKSISESIQKKFSDLMAAISDVKISRPLLWIVASISMVPLLTGSLFCYQTQCLNLEPSVIGMSKVIGQLMLLGASVLYNQLWRRIPTRKLVGIVQVVYAASLLLDLILVKQINLKLGIPNKVFALCFAGLSETVAQFKLLPISVLFASLCPHGSEGSVTSFLASAFCLSSIVSGFLGIGLSSVIGVTHGNYSRLDLGIAVQVFAALVPLKWLSSIPLSQSVSEKKRKMKNRTYRRRKRSGRLVFNSVYAYARGRECECETAT